jgi:hypothetical protein
MHYKGTRKKLPEIGHELQVDAVVEGTVVRAGEREQAFAWLEQAYQERSAALIWLKVEPQFDALRTEPRFVELLRRMGLTL